VNDEIVDLMRDVLDHEIVDCNDVPCGMADDLEMLGGPGSTLVVAAILVGTGAWSRRLPWFLPRLARAVLGRKLTRIPWAEVAVTSDRLKLKSSAKDLGLNTGDVEVERWFKRARR
jgi:hypothetical protein